MKENKNIPFKLAFILLIAVFLGLAVYTFILKADLNKSEIQYKKAVSAYNAVSSKRPSPDAMDLGEKNFDQFKVIAEEKRGQYQNADFEFVPLLKEQIDNPSSFLTDIKDFELRSWKGISVGSGTARNPHTVENLWVNPDEDFGFKMYLKADKKEKNSVFIDNPTLEIAQGLNIQVSIMNNILRILDESAKDMQIEDEKVTLLSFKRQMLASEIDILKAHLGKGVAKTRALQSYSGYKISDVISLKKEGVMDTTAFEISFVGQTEVLRRFLAGIEDVKDYFLVVRAVEVDRDLRVAKKIRTSVIKNEPTPNIQEEQVQEDLSFGNATASEGELSFVEESVEEVKPPIVSENESRFTVVIEYVNVLEKTEKKLDENNKSKNQGLN